MTIRTMVSLDTYSVLIENGILVDVVDDTYSVLIENGILVDVVDDNQNNGESIETHTVSS